MILPTVRVILFFFLPFLYYFSQKKISGGLFLYCRKDVCKGWRRGVAVKGENHNRSHFCLNNPSCHELPDDEIGVSADARSFARADIVHNPLVTMPQMIQHGLTWVKTAVEIVDRLAVETVPDVLHECPRIRLGRDGIWNRHDGDAGVRLPNPGTPCNHCAPST
jgi:hypothetical protein